MALPAWLQTTPPVLGVHLDARRVTAVLAELGPQARVRSVGSSDLPAGALEPSLVGANVLDRDACVRAIREAVSQVGGRHRRVALAIPDIAAKVSILSFEQLPANTNDLDQLVRLQLRKSIPFPVEQAQVAWTKGAARDGAYTVVVTAVRRDVVEEYERVCAMAGLHAGTVDLATFNAINLVTLARGEAAGDVLIVHVTSRYASMAIVRDGGLIVFRTRPADASEPLVDVVHQTRMYYEDRLNGQGFSQVMVLAGPDVPADVASSLTNLFDGPVNGVRFDSLTALTDRVQVPETLLAQIAPAAGLVLREVGVA